MKVAILDIGVSNLGSAVNMVRHLGHDPRVVASASELRGYGKLVLPGVGHFDAAMTELSAGGLDEAVGAYVRDGRELLGVCLGMQLLFESSAEGMLSGLGIIPGHVESFAGWTDGCVRIPHMGWNEVRYLDESLVDASEGGHWYYFVHSYAVPASNAATLGLTTHGVDFASVVGQDNVTGVQFHPEKSHRHGMRLLEQWISK